MFFSQTLQLLSLYLATATATTIPQSSHARRDSNGSSVANDSSMADYDFIVVGSGAGGGPLAARLAMAHFKVLLIDAGDDAGGTAPEQELPALQLQSTEYTPMRWDYYVNHYQNETRQALDTKMTWKQPDGSLHTGLHGPPDPNSTPLGILYPRAGALGGCTTHNALITIYPHESDWSNIQSITGDDSWAPDKMYPYFQRLENFHYPPLPLVDHSPHGLNGWLATERTSLKLVLKDTNIQGIIAGAAFALNKMGLLKNLPFHLTWYDLPGVVKSLANILNGDLNTNKPGRDATQGLYQVPIATKFGQRNGARDFIRQVKDAKNADGSYAYQLDVQLNTLVSRVLFDQNNSSTPRAVGVEYLKGKSLYRADPRADLANDGGTNGTVMAKREVILSAGAFNTPQLLKLSGVGPAAELQKFGIPVVKDMPAVGTNLQDRYETGLVGRTETPFPLTKDCTFDPEGKDPCYDDWLKDPTGDRGTYATNGIAVGLVHKSSTADSDPDLFIAGVPAVFRGYYQNYSVDAFADANHWTWITLKAHTHNTAGTVELRSKNPRDMPQINFNSFDTGSDDDGRDLQAVVEGMQLSRKLFENLPYTEEWPSANVTTDDEWKTFVKNEAWGHHASCTCPIGKKGDPKAVLDSEFKVQGIDGLRVVDASVFPKIPGFYIVTPIYVISEKAADVIIQANNGMSFDDQGSNAPGMNSSLTASIWNYWSWAP
ncbi:MAG: hypothetical protein M1838_005506 [Thelocarpon superellum]|nr:MAG: hypothetical protein M1838_005506 [Thelocarpon superellum]